MARTSLTVAQGVLVGTSSDDGEIAAFKGVPYAAPPVGRLRWKPPEPPASWHTPRSADRFAPACPQWPLLPNSLLVGGHEHQSEDCLYLNVWSGADDSDERRPVAVFFHLGGYQYGSASVPRYDGEALAREGLVVVSVNNRLNRFGFLVHPWLTEESAHDASGNYGLHDQIAALRWIQENIASFGGNPSSVTIFGVSAGSQTVNVMMASPLARGLFHRAVGQSGAFLGSVGSSCNMADQLQNLEAAERTGIELVDRLGVRTLEELRALSSANILQATVDPYGSVEWRWDGADASFFRGGLDSGYPIVDGYLLPERPLDIFARGEQAPVPLITGTTAKEATGVAYTPTLDAYLEDSRLEYGDSLDAFLSLYGASNDVEARAVSAESFGDRCFGAANWTWARLQAPVAPTYYYRFERVPPVPPGSCVEKEPGAFHSGEIPYVFRNLDVLDWPWERVDVQLSETMSRYWINFAQDGDPNGAGLPAWPLFDPDQPTTMRLGDEIEVDHVPDRDRMDFWDNFFDRADLVARARAGTP